MLSEYRQIAKNPYTIIRKLDEFPPVIRCMEVGLTQKRPVDSVSTSLSSLQSFAHVIRTLRSTVNNFVGWPHSGAVMHYSGYVEPQDGAVPVLLSFQ
jgi:hypothetical protein